MTTMSAPTFTRHRCPREDNVLCNLQARLGTYISTVIILSYSFTIVSITQREYLLSELFVLVICASIIKAFHRVQARARFHVSSSRVSVSRKTLRAFPLKNVQYIVRSQAGSPTASIPKSMTAASSLDL